MGNAEKSRESENDNQNSQADRFARLLTLTIAFFICHGSTSAMFEFANR